MGNEDVTTCCLAERYWQFRKSYCPHMQDKICFCYLHGSSKFLWNSAPAYQTAHCHTSNDSHLHRIAVSTCSYLLILSAAQMILLKEMEVTMVLNADLQNQNHMHLWKKQQLC